MYIKGKVKLNKISIFHLGNKKKEDKVYNDKYMTQ